MTDPLTTLLAIHEKAMATPWRARSDATVSTARKSFAHEVVLLKPTEHEGLDHGQMADNAAAVASAMNALPRLIAELREAQADTRRLDWLAQFIQLEDEAGAGGDALWSIKYDPLLTLLRSVKRKDSPTIRAAIDAAMAQEGAK